MSARRAVWIVAVAASVCVPHGAQADSKTVTGPLNLSAGVDLKFSINIDKFVYFRIGDGALPNPGGTPSTASFTLTPSIPSAPTIPANGSNKAVNWNGVAPTFSVNASGNVLPVEVRSNGGQVRLYASVSAPLANGSQTIPMSDITVSSDQVATLPAPALPSSGTGASVNVAGGGAGVVSSLVTLQSANWTFTMSGSNAASYAAGVYNGQVTFTASTP